MDLYPDGTLQKLLTGFPCMFNMERSAIKDEKDFKAKLETVLEEDDVETDVRKMNYITWLQFTLDNFRGEKKHESAMSWNEKAVQISKGNELVSLANKVYLLKYLGDEINSDKCFHLLESKKSDPNFRLFLADAKAQQAYCYARMGDKFNQDHAIDLYIQALQDKNDDQWNYGLGLACMRTIHGSMINHSFKSNINERVRKGANALFEVAERSPDDTLRGQSYMNLALLQSYARRLAVTKFCADDYRNIFKGLTVEQLIDKAVDLRPNDYKVLADCGRAIADDNMVKAKQLLENSYQIRRNSKACHQLGILTNDFVERLSLWFDAIKSHYRNEALERCIQKLLKNQMRGNLLKKCFVQRVQFTPGQKDVLVLAQEMNDMIDKVYNTLTNCFGLEATLWIQIADFITKVARHKVVILVVPRVSRRDFTDVIKRLVQMTSQNRTKVKALVPDSTVTIPENLQDCQPLSMSEIYEHAFKPGQVNYHSLLGSYQQMISFIKLFNFITE